METDEVSDKLRDWIDFCVQKHKLENYMPDAGYLEDRDISWEEDFDKFNEAVANKIPRALYWQEKYILWLLMK